MRIRNWITLAVFLAGVPAWAATDALTDTALVSRASAVFANKESPADRILGIHRGQRVLLEVLCSDACPANTVRIIHYMMPTDDNCTRLGGDIVGVAVSAGLTATIQNFCIPHVLVARRLYTDRPYKN